LSLILNIETATVVCSVALARDGQLIGLKESTSKNSHSSLLSLFMDEVIKSAGVEMADLDAIAISEGPGSYTGLRIGVAASKGLCFALDKPLIGVKTLQAMALGMTQFKKSRPNNECEDNILYCPMIDARRMEVYCAIFNERGEEIRETKAEVIDKNSFKEYLEKNMIVIAGDGSLKCWTLFEKQLNAMFLEDFQASAKFMTGLSDEKFSNKKFENLAYFEPYYLKDFVAGKPRVKGLR